MKLVTWNIQWGLGMDGRVDLARIVAAARELCDFDVLCLQEVADNFPELQGHSGENQFAVISALLPSYTAVDGVALDISAADGRRKRFGNMLLSRYPVHQVLRHALPWPADPSRNMPRILIEATVATPFGPVRVMTTHLEYWSANLRRAQVLAIREAHRLACDRANCPSTPGEGPYAPQPRSCTAILAGDFNLKPDDPTRGLLSESFEPHVPRLLDAWSVLHREQPHPPSFCIADQTYGEPHCCDFVFVTDDMAPKVKHIAYDARSRLSDHQPVLLHLANV